MLVTKVAGPYWLFHTVEVNGVGTSNCLVTNILQNDFSTGEVNKSPLFI